MKMRPPWPLPNLWPEKESLLANRPGKARSIWWLARDGLLVVDEPRLERFNLVPGVMCACRQGFSLLTQGRVLGATRAIPLFLPRADFHKAMAILSDGPLFQVLPLRQPRVGILVTGTEVFMGLVEDKFVPIITTKVEKFGGQVLKSLIVPDDRRAIGEGVQDLLNCGIDLLVTTAGLSVDPDDVTRQGLVDAGATDILYGAPILPGAMTLLAHIGPVQVMGVPACALYFKTTSFDLLLPRLLAGLEHHPARSGSVSQRCFLSRLQGVHLSPEMPVWEINRPRSKFEMIYGNSKQMLIWQTLTVMPVIRQGGRNHEVGHREHLKRHGGGDQKGHD